MAHSTFIDLKDREMRYLMVLDKEVMSWAFGSRWSGLNVIKAVNRWNRRHGDIFIIDYRDRKDLTFERISREYNKMNMDRGKDWDMPADEKVIKEVHADLVKRKVTGISYGKYRERLDVRDKGIAKREYEERKVRMGGSR